MPHPPRGAACTGWCRALDPRARPWTRAAQSRLPSRPHPNPLRSDGGCGAGWWGGRGASRTRGSSTASRWSRSSPGWGSARTGCRRRPTVPTRRSARSARTATSRSRSRSRRRSRSSSSRSPTRRSSSTSRSAAAATSSRPSCSGPAVGVVSGSALLVDYVLTITVSIASGADAIFSFLPPAMAPAASSPVEVAGDRRCWSCSTCAA